MLNSAPVEPLEPLASIDPLAVVMGTLVALITLALVVFIPLLVNHFWIGFIEVPVFMAGFGLAGSLIEKPHK